MRSCEKPILIVCKLVGNGKSEAETNRVCFYCSDIDNGIVDVVDVVGERTSYVIDGVCDRILGQVYVFGSC